MVRSIAVAVLLLSGLGVARAEDGGGMKRRVAPREFGRVVLASSHARKAKVAAVTFDHWLHRAKFTCRVCHVDLGFAMKAGGTDIRAADNAAGQYCGACHNDRTKSDRGNRIFAACKASGRADEGACTRCHSGAGEPPREVDFAAFTRNLPKARFGNGVDWEAAEAKKLIQPVDVIEGVSLARPAMPIQKDFALSGKLAGMPDIIFSHAKHTVWSGCEGCHPEIFAGVKRGHTKFTMVEIFEGRYCGACHVSVAFPTLDCQRCHSRPVQ